MSDGQLSNEECEVIDKLEVFKISTNSKQAGGAGVWHWGALLVINQFLYQNPI